MIVAEPVLGRSVEVIGVGLIKHKLHISDLNSERDSVLSQKCGQILGIGL